MSHLSAAQKLAAFWDNHWRVLLVPGGSVIFAILGALFPHDKTVHLLLWDLAFVLACTLTLLGSVALVRNQERFSQLEARSNEFDHFKRHRIFLVIASLTDEWQMELLHHLLNKLGELQFRATVFAPKQHRTEAQQDIQLKHILEEKHLYSGGIVIPMYPDRHESKL